MVKGPRGPGFGWLESMVRMSNRHTDHNSTKVILETNLPTYRCYRTQHRRGCCHIMVISIYNPLHFFAESPGFSKKFQARIRSIKLDYSTCWRRIFLVEPCLVILFICPHWSGPVIQLTLKTGQMLAWALPMWPGVSRFLREPCIDEMMGLRSQLQNGLRHVVIWMNGTLCCSGGL